MSKRLPFPSRRDFLRSLSSMFLTFVVHEYLEILLEASVRNLQLEQALMWRIHSLQHRNQVCVCFLDFAYKSVSKSDVDYDVQIVIPRQQSAVNHCSQMRARPNEPLTIELTSSSIFHFTLLLRDSTPCAPGKYVEKLQETGPSACRLSSEDWSERWCRAPHSAVVTNCIVCSLRVQIRIVLQLLAVTCEDLRT